MAALTLVEAAKAAFSAGVQQLASVIGIFANSSPVLAAMPFDNINGQALAFSREEALPGADFRGVNEGYTASAGVLSPQSDALKIIGGDLDVDMFITATMGPGVRSTHEQMKIKAAALRFGHSIIKGDEISNPKDVNGLQARINLSGPQSIAGHSTGATDGAPLELKRLSAAIEQTDRPTHIICTKQIRQLITNASLTQNIVNIQRTIDQFGFPVVTYYGLPILVIDPIDVPYQTLAFNEISPLGGSLPVTTSIYVVSFSTDGVHGIQHSGISLRNLGEVADAPVTRSRVEWYAGMTMKRPQAATRLHSITNAAVIA